MTVYSTKRSLSSLVWRTVRIAYVRWALRAELRWQQACQIDGVLSDAQEAGLRKRIGELRCELAILESS